MTDLRQAAQMALEALEGWEHCDEWVWPVSALEQSKRNTTESLAALRTALAQQAASKEDMKVYRSIVDNYWKGLAAAQPEQQAEPVGSLSVRYHRGCKSMTNTDFDYNGDLPEGDYELYTTPPQRPWVGLTVTTILDMMPSTIPAEYDGPLMEFARAVEAKLKERNT